MLLEYWVSAVILQLFKSNVKSWNCVFEISDNIKFNQLFRGENNPNRRPSIINRDIYNQIFQARCSSSIFNASLCAFSFVCSSIFSWLLNCNHVRWNDFVMIMLQYIQINARNSTTKSTSLPTEPTQNILRIHVWKQAFQYWNCLLTIHFSFGASQ
jgi:hypothetical protein